MALCVGIKIAVNGSETDVDVENDSASWTTKIGNIRHTTGGGSFTKLSNPGVLQFDAAIPIQDAHKVRTITVAMALDTAPVGLATGVTMDDYTPIVGTGLGAYRIIFHGDVQSAHMTNLDFRAASQDSDRVQFDALSEMSGLLNRRARCALLNNGGIVSMLDDIATAHSLTILGSDKFPTVANGFQNSDRPKQKRVTNGQYIATMLAGSGINMTEEWSGTITAPALEWRPDLWEPGSYYSGRDADHHWDIEIGYPWRVDYPDVGMVPGDFSARITVNGEDSAGAQYYGWAELDTAALRAKCGSRDTALTSYIDNAADCKQQARRLLAYQGDPSHVRMVQMTLNTEVYYRACAAGVYFGSGLGGNGSPEGETFFLAAMMPGDTLYKRGYVYTNVGGSDGFGNGNNDYGDWPTGYDVSSGLRDTLSELWGPYIQLNGGTTSYTADYHTVRSITRTFDPQGGWNVTYGLEPITHQVTATDVNVSDTGSGTD